MARWVEGELLTVRALDVLCEDCGRTRRLMRRRLIELDEGGVKSLHQLGTRLRCRACLEQKGTGSNVSLKPQWFTRSSPPRSHGPKRSTGP